MSFNGCKSKFNVQAYIDHVRELVGNRPVINAVAVGASDATASGPQVVSEDAARQAVEGGAALPHAGGQDAGGSGSRQAPKPTKQETKSSAGSGRRVKQAKLAFDKQGK